MKFLIIDTRENQLLSKLTFEMTTNIRHRKYPKLRNNQHYH